MYDFHYNYIMKKFPTARLLFTDTDSLCYHIETEKDLYDEIRVRLTFYQNILSETFIQDSQWMDFSNYPPEHINFSKDKHLVPGYFKDENGQFLSSYNHFYISFNLGGKPIEEFCGLRAKMYSVKSPNHEKKAAKGVSGKKSLINS